jgi:autotransporter adhesin
VYTDTKFDQLSGRIFTLDGRINSVERVANRGIAASLAMRQLPAAIGPGESAVTVGVHHVTRRNLVISGGVAT